jgi:hypothetical protein
VDIETPGYGVADHAKSTGEFSRIEHLALIVLERLPICDAGFHQGCVGHAW